MTCREIAELLLDFLGRDLPPEVQEAIKSHLCDCQPCGDFVGTYELTILISRQLRPVEMPPSFMDRLQAAHRAAEQSGTLRG